MRTGDLFAHYLPVKGYSRSAILGSLFDEPGSGFGQLTDSFQDAFLQTDIYAVLLEGLTGRAAERLHGRLSRQDAYIGSVDLNLRSPIHQYLYHASLVPSFHVLGHELQLLYGLEPGREEVEGLREGYVGLGFEAVTSHQIYARHSAFDATEDPGRWRRLAVVDETLGRVDDLLVTGVLVLLEDTSERLVDSVIAGCRSIRDAQTSEDVAQVALSARRFLKHLADAAFPPRATEYKGHEVTEEKYLNRLWAYIDRVLEGGPEERAKRELSELGERIGTLYRDACAGVHGDKQVEHAGQVMVDLIRLVGQIFDLTGGRPDTHTKVGWKAFEAFMARIAGDE